MDLVEDEEAGEEVVEVAEEEDDLDARKDRLQKLLVSVLLQIFSNWYTEWKTKSCFR